MGNSAWKQEGIIFNIEPPQHENHNTIPQSCATWYDGCNTCMVSQGKIRGCTRMMCFRKSEPYCRGYSNSNSAH